jgi:hypothetical protein
MWFQAAAGPPHAQHEQGHPGACGACGGDRGAGVARGREAEHLKLAASILSELRVAIVTDEKPMQFHSPGGSDGVLPSIPEAVRKFAAAQSNTRGLGSAISKAKTASSGTPVA